MYIVLRLGHKSLWIGRWDFKQSCWFENHTGLKISNERVELSLNSVIRSSGEYLSILDQGRLKLWWKTVKKTGRIQDVQYLCRILWELVSLFEGERNEGSYRFVKWIVCVSAATCMARSERDVRAVKENMVNLWGWGWVSCIRSPHRCNAFILYE